MAQQGETLQPAADRVNLSIEHNFRRTMMAETERWLKRERKESMDYKPMQYVHMMLANGADPWKYIRSTKQTAFIDTCMDMVIKAQQESAPSGKEFVNRWLEEEGIFYTVY